ncbi:MAG TPA: HIT domain-containing protein [Egibacteraceae bacterium]|nr:HIT domain-containing protein [Egibacteraceae bacterium]
MSSVDPADRRVDEQRIDELQRLWTPWRMSYIRDPDRRATGCPFCALPARGPELDRESLILYRGPTAYAILNAFPYNPGHIMAVPYRHLSEYEDLTAEEASEIAELCQRSVRALKASSAAAAFNIGMNVGQTAGAGIADHIHQHVVPRWGGDTNFMPVIGQTRVLPELLEETFDRLAPIFGQV